MVKTSYNARQVLQMAKRPQAIEMASAIEFWALDKLKPYERNARTHSPEQVDKIASSIIEFGFTNPILVDGDAGIIAGHGRLMAASKLGLAQIPVIELTHLTEAQKRAYVLADNRLAEDAGWDEELLAGELAALQDMEFDLSLTGFNEEEMADLLGSGISEARLPDLPSGGKEPFQQKTFTLHDDQADQVDRALALAKQMGEFDTRLNENGNGNALARVCELFISQNGG
jgi:ParB family chromosome partitioning protein